MEVPLDNPIEEIKRLQRCINDLVSILSLPAIWAGGEQSKIASTLLDTLLPMLGLDLVYVRLKDPVDKKPVEMVRVAPSRKSTAQPQEIAGMFNSWFGGDPREWPAQVRKPIGGADISTVPFPLGIHGEIGMIVVGSGRVDFPRQIELLLMNVAVNQASLWLQEARLLDEQKRVANELDQRVAQRTMELAAANEELRLQVGVLQLIPAAAFTLKPDGTPDFVNQNWLDYSGQTLDFVRSDPEAWMTAVHPGDHEMTVASFWEGVRSGQGFSIEARLRRVHDGAYRWHLNRAVALRDAEGKLLKFVGTALDVEDLKQSQGDLLKAEERTRLIIDTALDAVVTMDARGAITTWNKQAEIIFGWSSGEAVGKRMSEMIIPERLRMAHERGLSHFLATGDGPILGRRIEVTAMRRGGGEFPVELEVIPMKLGQDLFFSAFIRDITDSKLAEEKLRRSAAYLVEAQKLSRTGSFDWNAPSGEFSWSDETYSILDVDRATKPSMEIVLSRIHPDDVNMVKRTLYDATREGKNIDRENRLLLPDGTVKYVHVVAHASGHGPDNNEFVGAIMDVTERRLAEQAFDKLRSELAYVSRITSFGTLTASIAHEVNQPLAAVVTNASACLRLLDLPTPDLKEAREAIQSIIRDGNRGSEVIGRIRTMLKKEQPLRTRVNINETVEETVKLAQFELQGTVLQMELEKQLPCVYADRVQLQQVLLNLMMNAIDAMKPVSDRPHTLRIETKPHGGDAVLVSVQDSGIGLKPDDMEQLFETFYTTKPEGLGMGLSISHSIIESHGGRLWAECNDGPGATFQFTLPAENGAHV